MQKTMQHESAATKSMPRHWQTLLSAVVSRRQSAPLLDCAVMDRHLEGAVGWLLTARQNSLDAGIPACFDLLRNRWAPSYPETTGYTIPSLLSCSAHLGRPDLRDIAIALADYLLEARTAEGGVGHWSHREPEKASPVVFDTGQVISGWLAAWRAGGNPAHLEAAEAAGKWLLDVQDASGAWIRYQHRATVKVIDTRVAWVLLQLAEATSNEAYAEGARRNLSWALGQQQPNGWFRHAAFLPDADPFTHTIAYTAEGLLESGLLLGEEGYIKAAQQVADVMLRLQRADGSLASTYNGRWAPTSPSSCLTGNCQMAIIWLRLHHLSAEPSYLDAARRAVEFVAGTQNLRTTNPNVRGAIAGSFPIYGRYERFLYPNWAAKFFIDALLALESTVQGLTH